MRLHFTLGVLLAANKQYEPAGRELAAADALEPGTFEILFNLGQVYLRSGQPTKAEAALERALKLQPDSPETLYYLAQAKADLHRDLEALELLVKARKLAPTNTDVIFLAARLSMNERFHEDAIPWLEEGLKIAPNRADLHAALGECYFIAGKVDKALLEFQALTKLDPSARSYAFAALAYRNLGRFDEAKTYLEQGLKLDPRNPACLYNLGYIASRQGDYDEAERDLKIFQTLSKDSSSGPYPFQNLFDYLDKRAGLAPTEQSRVDLEQLRQEVKIHPDRPQNIYLLASEDLDAGQVEEARQAIARLDQLSQGDFRTAVGVGVLLARHRLYREAVEHFQAALKANPGSDDTWFDLADAYFRARDYQDALASLQHVSPDGQKDTGYVYLLGDIYAHLGQIDQAARLFRQVIAVNPDKDQAYLSLALTYLRSGNAPNAERTLEEGLARTYAWIEEELIAAGRVHELTRV